MNWSSGQRIAYTLLIACGGVWAQTSRDDTRSEVAVLRQAVQQLQSEVARLRKDLAQIELDRHRQILRLIGSELNGLYADRSRLDEEDRIRNQDIGDMIGLLASRDLSDSGRTDLQAAVTELTVAQARKIEDQREAARVRERELLRQLQTEEQTVKRLEEALKPVEGNNQ